MMLTEDEAQGIARRILERSRADSCSVYISGDESANLRFAGNGATTNGFHREIDLTIRSHFGDRSGSASITALDDAAVAQALARSEDIARSAPPDPEFMPPLGPQGYPAGAGFDGATAGLSPRTLNDAAAAAICSARDAGLDASGYVQAGSRFLALANSAGLRAYERRTHAELTVSARRRAGAEGQWSGWAGAASPAFERFGADRLARRAVAKGSAGGRPFDLDPGSYTVVLEPAAVASLAAWLIWFMDARLADEGRSFLSRKGGGTKSDERLFDERLTILSDPADPAAPDAIHGAGGLPSHRTVWIQNGVPANLYCSRFWARKSGRAPLSPPLSAVIEGGAATLEDMIAGVRRGVLITRFWYINMVDPRTLLLTGLTRDGNFLIENGKVAGPARNLRFNESLVALFDRIEAIGPAELTASADDGGYVVAPPLLVRDFTFSSRSGGI